MICIEHSFFYCTRKRDGELSIRQKELQLEHRHAQLKEQLSARLSCGSEFISNFTLQHENKYSFVVSFPSQNWIKVHRMWRLKVQF